MSSGEDRYPRPNPPRARPKPKPKPKPRRTTRAVMPGDPGFGTGPDVRARARRGTPGSTSARVKVNKLTGRVTQPKYRSKPKPDADFARAVADVARYEGRKTRNPITGVEQAGFFDPRFAQMLRGTPGSFLGNLLGNFGGDVTDVITGIPNAAQLAGKNVAYPVLKALGKDETANEILKENVTSLKGAVEDYKYRWGPLLEGDPGKFWTRFQEHPGLDILDASALASVAGSGLRATAAGIGRIAPETRLGAAAARTGSKSVVTHARPDRVIEAEIGPNTGLGAKGRATSRLVVPQRPFSVSNPGTRLIQRGANRLRRGAETRINRRVVNEEFGHRVLRYWSANARHQRAATKIARDQRLQADLTHAVELRKEAAPYVQAVKDLDKSVGRGVSREAVDGLLDLHFRDMLDVPGKTPRQALNDVIATRRANMDRAVKAGGIKNKAAQHQLDKYVQAAQLPDEYLSLKTAPAPLVKAVEEGRALATRATEMRVAAGAISRETAATAPKRAAQMVHEGAHYNHKAGLWTSPRNPYSPVGKNAVYVKDIPADPLKGGRQPGSSTGAFGRRTAEREYESHGTLQRTGNVLIDRGLPVKSMKRALIDRDHAAHVKSWEDTFAFRRPSGKLARGRRAVIAMEADPESVVLIKPSKLHDAARLSDEIPDGEWPDSPLRGAGVYEGAEGLAKAREFMAKNPKSKDLIAVPKGAVTGMREGWDAIAGGKWKGFDSAQALWKRGILSFFPRWYFNSLFGNTTQYLFATGGDFKSVYQALRNRREGRTLNPRVPGQTNVQEARLSDPIAGKGTRVGDLVRRLSDPGLRFQGSFDSLYREALEINRARQQMRAEGVKTRGLSGDDFAAAYERLPAKAKDQIVRETELWLGDYMRLSPAERASLRRIFPFYSWMRVIGKLTLSMPVRYPKRTAIIALLSRAATESQNDLDPLQDIIANRGMYRFPGGLAMRSAASNSFFTHGDIIKNAADLDAQGLAQSIASNLTPIGGQQAARIFSGRTAFGAPLSFAPGAEGTASQFGRSTKRISPSTGLPEYFTPTSVLEAVLESVPYYTQARQIAAGSRQPYDNVTLLDILRGGDPGQLYRPENDRTLTPFTGPLGAALSASGANVQRYNRKNDEARIKKMLKDWEDAQKQTAKRKRKVK